MFVKPRHASEKRLPLHHSYLSLGVIPAKVEDFQGKGVARDHPVCGHDEAEGLGRGEEETRVVQLQHYFSPDQVWNLVKWKINRSLLFILANRTLVKKVKQFCG